MDRLTHERCNGIKTGYWSAAKKEELVQHLAAYENTGLTPKEIKGLTGARAQIKAMAAALSKCADICELCAHYKALPVLDCEESDCDCDICKANCGRAGCEDGRNFEFREEGAK